MFWMDPAPMSVEDCSSTPCKSYECGRQLVGWLVSVRQGEGGSRRLLILTLMYSWSFADWAQRILKLLLETDKEGRKGGREEGRGSWDQKGTTLPPSKVKWAPLKGFS